MSDIRRLEPGISLLQVTLDDYDVRGALVVGAQRAVVWDTLSHPRNMDPFVPLIGDRDLVIVYSHADWDHIWVLQVFRTARPHRRSRALSRALRIGRPTRPDGKAGVRTWSLERCRARAPDRDIRE